MAEEEKDSFVMHRSFLSGIPEEEQFKWFKIICDFAFDGVKPQFENWYEEKIWNTIESRINADQEAYEKRVEYQKRYYERKKGNKNNSTVENFDNVENVDNVENFENFENFDNVDLNTRRNTEFKFKSEFKSDSKFKSEFKSDIDSNSEFKERGEQSSPAPAKKNFKKPTLEEIKAYMAEMNYTFDAGQFYDHYEANGWVQGKGKKITDWKAAVRNWNRREKEFSDPFYSNSATISGDKPQANYEYDDSDWGETK